MVRCSDEEVHKGVQAPIILTKLQLLKLKTFMLTYHSLEPVELNNEEEKVKGIYSHIFSRAWKYCLNILEKYYFIYSRVDSLQFVH